MRHASMALMIRPMDTVNTVPLPNTPLVLYCFPTVAPLIPAHMEKGVVVEVTLVSSITHCQAGGELTPFFCLQYSLCPTHMYVQNDQ